MPVDVSFTILVPVEVRGKAIVEAGQVHVLDAYMVNDQGGTHVRNLGEMGYIKVLDMIAVEAREENARRREDFDARR
jgi:Ser-tRNA(Ala) deacylase AlaX